MATRKGLRDSNSGVSTPIRRTRKNVHAVFVVFIVQCSVGSRLADCLEARARCLVQNQPTCIDFFEA